MLDDRADEVEILRHAFQFFDKDGSGDISIAVSGLGQQEPADAQQCETRWTPHAELACLLESFVH